MAEGFRGLRPFLALEGGVNDGLKTGAAASASFAAGQGTVMQAGAVASASAVSGSSNTAAVNAGSSQAAASVTATNPLTLTDAFPSYRFWLGVSGMSANVGASLSWAQVNGAPTQTIVRTGDAFSVAAVAGRNASLGGTEAFPSYRFWFGVQGSTTPVPWGLSTSLADVTGQGVYSVAGDYATPLRSVFDIPPPADFKPPGVTLDYGLPASLRAAGAVLGEILAGSFVAGERKLGVSAAAGSASQASATAPSRAAVSAAGEAASASQVRGVAVGVITLVETGAAFAASAITGRDGSLGPGVRLGTATAESNAQATGRLENTQTPAIASAASAFAVDVSGYPLAAPAGAVLSGAEVAGEAIATIVATAVAQGAAAAAAVQAVLIVAEAAASSLAAVSGRNAAIKTVSPGGRWPRGPRHPGNRPVGVNTRRPAATSS